MSILLNDVQLGMLYHTKKENSIHGIYNSQVVIEWKEPVDCAKLQQAWDYLIQTYDVLRSYLKNNSILIFSGNLTVKINVINQKDSSEKEIDETIKQLFSQPFNLYVPPLFDLTLLQVRDDLSYLVWTHHHILLSTSSITEITRDMFKYYDGTLPANQQKKTMQYAQYPSTFCKQDKVYWEKLLSGFTESNQMKIPHPQEIHCRPQHHNHMVKTNLRIEAFMEQASRLGVTVNTLFLAAWSIILNRYTADDDIVFGTVRRQSVVENHVGMDINTLPIRVIFTKDTSIYDLCVSIRKQQVELRKHSNLSLREINKHCFHKQNVSDELFSTFVDYQPISVQDLLEEAGINMQNRHFRVNSRTHYPINIAVYFEKGILNLKFDYNESLFSKVLIAQIERHYLHVIHTILGEQNTLCSTIDIFDNDEKKHYIEEINNTQKCYDREALIHEIVQRHAKKNPKHIAIIDGDLKISYQELDQLSGQIASHLIKYTKENDVIAIQTDSRANQIILMLSVLKAGGIYLNINTIYPASTKKLLIKKSNATAMIVDDKQSIEFDGQDIKIFSINELRASVIVSPVRGHLSNTLYASMPLSKGILAFRRFDKCPRTGETMTEAELRHKVADKALSSRVTKDKFAYIIFTSGSTGEPKATLIKQHSVINLLQDTNYIQIKHTDVMAQIANPSFDAATFEIWGALLNGATCVIVPKNVLLNFDQLDLYMSRNAVNMMLCITSLFNQIAQQKPEIFRSLRYLVVGGEALYAKYVQLVLTACNNSDISIVNAYGPTENTVISTFYSISKSDELPPGMVPIGKPISNVKIFILDSKKRLVPAGVIGELHLAGEGLAFEYYKNKKATQEKFIESYGDQSERIYCTGDYVYLDHEDNLHFVGRRDAQVKINGYRIELSEIKKHLLSHSGLKEVELVIDEIDDRKNIVAFISFKHSTIPGHELKEHLRKYLPDYMIPSTFVGLSSLPMTVNHKVDLNQLKLIEQQSNHTSPESPLSTTIDEKMLFAWEKTFGRKMDQSANFFDLGGDSIDALQLIYYASEKGLHIQVDDLFKFPNIQDLNQHCSTKSSEKLMSKLFSTERKCHGFLFPTPIQSWFMAFGAQHLSQFSQICRISLKSNMSLNDIKVAFGKLMKHHDVLRLRLTRSSDGKVIYPYVQPFSACAEGDFVRYADNDHHLTDIFNGPIVSVFLNSQRTSENHELTVAINHLAVDGVSWRVFIEDLNILLTHQNDEAYLSEKTLPYIEWSEQLFQLAQTEKTLALAPQWLNTNKIGDEEKPIETFENADCYENTIDENLIIELEKIAKSQSFQFSDMLLLSFLMALEEMGASTAITIETHGRDIMPELDVSRTIGWFTTLCPFHFKYGISSIHVEDIYRLSKTIIELKDSGYSYGLLKYMTQQRLGENTHLIDLPSQYFNYLGNLDGNDTGPCAIESIEARVDKAFPLYFSLSADLFLRRNVLFFKVTYNNNCYSQAYMERFFSCFTQKLSELNQFFKKESSYPLSPVQAGIYAHCNIHPESESYFVQAICDMKGTVKISQLKRACEQLINANDIFRSRFHSTHGVILQTVDAEVTTSFSVRDWSKDNNHRHSERIVQFLNSDRQTIFHLSHSPLVRFTLIQLSDSSYKLIASFHHIIMDGWSFYLAFKQLIDYYKGDDILCDSNTFYSQYIKPLPYISKTAESKDFWITYLDKESLSARLNFHKQYETDVSYKELPHIKHTMPLSSELTKKLRSFSSKYEVTLNAIIQSAWAISLSEYSASVTASPVRGPLSNLRKARMPFESGTEAENSNHNKVSYGMACSGRGTIQRLLNVIGPVISTLPCAVSIDTSLSMLEFIRNMQSNIMTLQQHEHANLLVISKHLDVEPKDLFEYLFVYENYPTSELLCHDFLIEKVEIIERTQYPLTIYVIDDQEIRIQVQYDSCCFDASDMQLFLQSFMHQIELMASHPNEIISEYYMRAVMESDKRMNHRLIKQDGMPYDAVDVSILIQHSVQQKRLSTAIVFEDRTITYDQLFVSIQTLQQHLVNHYPTQTVIGIFLERSPEYIIALLAVLQANCVFVPLDVSFPDARLSVMVKQAGIQVMITESKLIRPDLKVDAIMLDTIDMSTLKKERTPEVIQYSPHDLAYILFTSGSTGTPKGVTISRGAIASMLESVANLLSLPEPLKVMGVSSFIFDISLIDILLPLTRQGMLILTNTHEQMDSHQQEKYISYYQVNFMQATPTTWKILLDSGWKPSKDLILISTGEALPTDLRDTFISFDCHVWNLYGPTETTIWATGLSLSHTMSKFQPASCIGEPLLGVDCYVMNSKCESVKPGIVGELYIGGKGLSNGYVNAPDLTHQQFITHPENPGIRLYKTADLVRFTPHFGLEYRGRVDTQVKIHGRRIELEEIEAILMKEENISFAITVVTGDLLSKKIIAFICLSDPGLKQTFDIETFKLNIKTKLPNFMLPSHIQIIDEMPLTSTNKVDRKILQSWASSLKIQDHAIIEPTNDIQTQLRKLWSETLSLSEKDISIDDDYFLLGGNSISAITLSVAIERLFSIYFPIHYVIENPILSAQAEKIVEQKDKYKTKNVYSEHDILNDLQLPLVPIQIGDHERSIFLIHPIGGTIFRYMPLARYLGKYYNVYGIQDPGIEAQAYLFDSLEALASHYLKVIQAQQPHGPYIIGGASYGGNVSIEIARQLYDKGIYDIHILSFDAWAVYPAMANNNRDWFENNIIRQAADLRQSLPSDMTLPELLLDLTWQRQQLIVQYAVQKRPYNLALFKAKTLSPVLEPIQEEYNHWLDFCESPIDKYDVPGDHLSMLNEPNASVLYKNILDYLNKYSLGPSPK